MHTETESSPRQLDPAIELRHFKAIIRSILTQAESILADIELSDHSPEIEDKLMMLDHCLDHARRLSE